jgi:uncharacterized protein YndB with AHSA1/START domain
MSSNTLVLTRDFDLPRAIVWDAFVDADLVEGWLAVAYVDAREGGEYRLEWQGNPLGPTTGVITVFEPFDRLVIETDNAGILDFGFIPFSGGTRGSATTVTLALTVATERRLLASTMANWRSNFDQLEGLLRGHPVDWDSWQQDRGAIWTTYLHEAATHEAADGA